MSLAQASKNIKQPYIVFFDIYSVNFQGMSDSFGTWVELPILLRTSHFGHHSCGKSFGQPAHRLASPNSILFPTTTIHIVTITHHSSSMTFIIVALADH
jgi:hypothetical protein